MSVVGATSILLNLTPCPIRHIISRVHDEDKPLVWLEGEIKTPPFTKAARIEAGTLLRRLQRGELLALPHSRPMRSIRQTLPRAADSGRDKNLADCLPNRFGRDRDRRCLREKEPANSQA